MRKHHDRLETRSPRSREADLFARLPAVIAAALALPVWRRHLKGVQPESIGDRQALARLPVLRKSDLPALQGKARPFGGLVSGRPADYRRLLMSPGPIFEAEGRENDPWRAARALTAAGVGRRDLVLNTFSYHLTPGAWCFDAGAATLGCAVIPAGPGQSDAQLDLIEAYRPTIYAGVPDFLKILLDLARDRGRDVSSLRRAVVSGAAFPPSLQTEFRGQGIEAYQCYATAECGIIAYETPAREGLVANEDLILEVLHPGTGTPVADGEIGEITVTILDPRKPLIRFATGDLSASLPGPSPCGRTNLRIRGWLGRADQSTKVKGMFVRPEQVAAIAARHAELGRCRLVVTRRGEADAMCLKVEVASPAPALAEAVAASLRAITKLSGAVEFVAPGALPKDGKVIEDLRTLA
jgi:phenylacetate-CoA ligase